MVAEEFSTERQLRAMRVIIAGPPASGKETLCKAVSDHFNIPLLKMDLKDLDATRAQLGSEVCRYRGYVLNAGLAGWQEVEGLFCQDYELPVDPDAEEEPPPPPEDEEDGEPKPPEEKKIPTERLLSKEGIVPAFAVLLQAPEALCRARYTAGKKGAATNFLQDMAQYTARNLVDGQANFADFFQDTAKIGVFNLPMAGKSEEDMFESTRIFMESGQGRPFNYLKSAEEVAEELLAKQVQNAEAAALASTAEREVSDGKVISEADAKRHIERLRIIEEHEAQRAQLEALPLREYLMKYMVPSLTEGLIEMCSVIPENPVDYLANYLEQHAAREQDEN
jgi:adenylate kinase